MKWQIVEDNDNLADSIKRFYIASMKIKYIQATLIFCNIERYVYECVCIIADTWVLECFKN